MRELDHKCQFWAAVIPVGEETKYLANRHWGKHAFHYTEKLNRAQMFNDKECAEKYLDNFEYASGYELVPVVKTLSIE